MHQREKFDGDSISNCDDFSPADLIETLRLKSTTIDQHEIARVEWFWRRRPKILCANLVFAFSYLNVLVCLFLLFAADNLFTPCLDWCGIELFLGGLFPVRAVEK